MKAILIILVFVGIGQQALASSCRNYSPRVNDCQFYQCLEETYSCGEQGYPLSYGHKYCESFSALNENNSPDLLSGGLTSSGITWRNFTLRCLQDELRTGLLNSSMKSCEEVKDTGFKTHAGCYTSGPIPICQVTAKDWVSIIGTVSIWDYFSIDAAKQMKEVIAECAPDIVDRYSRNKSMLESIRKESLYSMNNNKSGLQNASSSWYISSEEQDLLDEQKELIEKLKVIGELRNELNQ